MDEVAALRSVAVDPHGRSGERSPHQPRHEAVFMRHAGPVHVAEPQRAGRHPVGARVAGQQHLAGGLGGPVRSEWTQRQPLRDRRGTHVAHHRIRRRQQKSDHASDAGKLEQFLRDSDVVGVRLPSAAPPNGGPTSTPRGGRCRPCRALPPRRGHGCRGDPQGRGSRRRTAPSGRCRSTTVTGIPLCWNAFTTTRPMKPQPPVISTRPPLRAPTMVNLSSSRVLRRGVYPFEGRECRRRQDSDQPGAAIESRHRRSRTHTLVDYGGGLPPGEHTTRGDPNKAAPDDSGYLQEDRTRPPPDVPSPPHAGTFDEILTGIGNSSLYIIHDRSRDCA